MVTKDAIDSALTAHSAWKQRLVTAVATGTSDFKPPDVSIDNACQFGKWLYALPPHEMQSEHCQKVKALHADFHKSAGEILRLALTGRAEEAKKRLESGGDYMATTGKLAIALQTWKSKL
jgi:hypothetical protein